MACDTQPLEHNLFENNLRNGYARYIDGAGNYYEGFWENNQFSGVGKEIDKDVNRTRAGEPFFQQETTKRLLEDLGARGTPLSRGNSVCDAGPLLHKNRTGSYSTSSCDYALRLYVLLLSPSQHF